MTVNSNANSKNKIYFWAIVFTLWCYFNIFLLPNLFNLIPASTKSEIAPGFELMLVFLGAMLFYGPFVVGTIVYYELGKSLYDADSFKKTLVSISTLILSYVLVIIIIWYPTTEHLINALQYNLQNPSWGKFGICAFVIFYVIKETVKKPFDSVSTTLLAFPAIHHLLKLYTWYRMDDGCRTDDSGYTDCDNSYVQIKDKYIEEASLANIPADALVAAELYILILYCFLIYIAGGVIKIKIFGA